MVKAWKETVTIPTYEIGAEEQNPIFLEKRVYQGSSGAVYPYPVVERIADRPTPHEWHAVWLENEYIKVMILPELGGRVQMAYDKVARRHFVYYNHVIKPALVGLTGPWISGGIEFNWPQHHRPSTYLPVDVAIEEGAADGSVTVWVNEVERMFHQKGRAGFTLRPGCAYLEIRGRCYNGTQLPQTFLWWANPAVEVNDAYQSVFPPDVNAVFDHGKRAVSTFPIATGTYYKVDYSAGVDISNYRNIPVPTSYMAVNSRYDFEGGYENDTQAGMLHVASHHVSPGKKQWTWGNGDFGRAWDRNLTDDAAAPVGGLAATLPSGPDAPLRPGFRPYIELMAGVFTENQPDFTWLMPGEEKEFTQYFMPYRQLGVVKQASRDFILNVADAGADASGRRLRLQVMATGRHRVAVEVRSDGGEVYYAETRAMTPEALLDETIAIGSSAPDAVTVTVRHAEGPEAYATPLVWHAEPDEVRRVPDSAEAALPPAETKTVEQLYLTGLHLEQYRHATWSALDYYEEGLRRDPDDVRCNNQMGLWYLRRGRFDRAEPYLRRAVAVLRRRNPNPYDGEPAYLLALCLKYLGRMDEAHALFRKAAWSKGWADAALLEAARISTAQGRLADALEEADAALVHNAHHHKARALRAALLRRMGRPVGAFAGESLALDLFNHGVRRELLLSGDAAQAGRLAGLMRDSIHNYHELALDYAQAGLWQDAADVLATALRRGLGDAMTHYYLAWARRRLGHAVGPVAEGSMRCCFPNRLEDVLALRAAGPDDARAQYLLGCLYYDKRQYDVAVRAWERSAQLDPTFPTAWRNLALAAFNKEHDAPKAVRLMERAFGLDPTDSRILMELDQLYKRLQRPHAERLAFLQRHPQLIAQRDDLALEEITLLNQTGRHDEARARLDARTFHPWEGGEGKVPAQYQIARVELAKQALARGDADAALGLLAECLGYPHHLGEGKLSGAQENDFHYLMGRAHDLKGDADAARRCYTAATAGPTEPAAAMYYNDAQPDKIFYAALAWLRLGMADRACGLFYRLTTYGEKHLFDTVRMDYFAVSLPDLLIWDGDLQQRNTVHCRYMMALGYWGIALTRSGDEADALRRKALRSLDAAASLDANHAGIAAFRTLVAALGL